MRCRTIATLCLHLILVNCKDIIGDTGHIDFREKALASWSKYEQHFESWISQAKGTINAVAYDSASKTLWDYSLDVLTDERGFARVDLQRKNAEMQSNFNSREVFGSNSKYAFSAIANSPLDSNGDLVMSFLDADRESERAEFEQRKFVAELNGASLVRLPMIELASLFKLNGLEIKSVSEQPDVTVVEFSLANDPKRSEHWGLNGGILNLDTQNLLCLKSATLNVESMDSTPAEMRVAITSKEVEAYDNFRVAVDVEQVLNEQEKVTNYEFSYDLEAVNESIDETEFTMSHFGLSEPKLGQQNKQLKLALIIVNIIAIILLTLYFFFRKRRSSAKLS